MDVFRAVSVGQGDEVDEAGAAVDQGGDGSAVPAAAGDQIAFPAAGAFAELDGGGALVDECHRDGEPRGALVGVAALLAQGATRAQLLGECSTQDAFRALVERPVDALVAEVALGLVRPQGAQVSGDLPGAPLQVEPALDLGVEPQLWPARPLGPLPGAVMGEVGVVDALVVFEHVAAQFATDGRWRSVKPFGDLTYAQAAFAQGGDALALQQRQVAARVHGLGHPLRWQAAVFRPPPVAGLPADPKLPAGLDRAHSGLRQSPVLRLDLEPALTSPPRHQHTHHDQGVLRQALEPKRRRWSTFHPSATIGCYPSRSVNSYRQAQHHH